MKKSLVLMAMAGVALAGCVNDVADVAQQEVQKKAKIGFEAPLLYDNAQSRANVFEEYNNGRGDFEGYSYPKAEDFVVFSNKYTGFFSGWNSQNNYWEGVDRLTVSYNQTLNGWVNSGKDYYWPSGDAKLAFAAYSPADMRPFKSYTNKTTNEVEQENNVEYGQPEVSYDKEGLSITGFKVPDNPACQFEVLYSERSLGNKFNTSAATGVYAGTSIKFKHALSSIHFALQKDAAVGSTIALKSIKLKGVKNKGNFKENLDESVYNVDGDIKNPYKIDPKWTNQEGNMSYAAYNAKGTDGVVFPPNAPSHVSLLSKTLEGDESYALLLMPQQLTGENVKLEVAYTISGKDADPVTITLGTDDQLGTDESNPNKPQITVNEWKPGVKYTYVLYYSAEAESKDKIIFAPSTEGWQEVSHIVINLADASN